MSYNEMLLFEDYELYTDTDTQSDIQLYNEMYDNIAQEEQY